MPAPVMAELRTAVRWGDGAKDVVIPYAQYGCREFVLRTLAYQARESVHELLPSATVFNKYDPLRQDKVVSILCDQAEYTCSARIAISSDASGIIAELQDLYPDVTFEERIFRDEFSDTEQRNVQLNGNEDVIAAWYWLALWERLPKQPGDSMMTIILESDKYDADQWYNRSDQRRALAAWKRALKGNEPNSRLMFVTGDGLVNIFSGRNTYAKYFSSGS